MRRTTVGLLAGRLCALWKRVTWVHPEKREKASMEASRRAVGKEARRHAGRVERASKRETGGWEHVKLLAGGLMR